MQRLARLIVAVDLNVDGMAEQCPTGAVVILHIKQEIADALVISERTARTHVSHVLRKLQLNSRTQGALVAVREGLVPPPVQGTTNS